jgi:hypothetical protein
VNWHPLRFLSYPFVQALAFLMVLFLEWKALHRKERRTN